MAGLGVSFVPGGQAENNRDKVQQQGGNALQQAIQFLSLRLPRVTGAQGIAPAPLLNAPGGGGMPPGIIEALLRLAGQPGNRGQGGREMWNGPSAGLPFAPPPMGGSMGTPHITPGEGMNLPMPQAPVQGPGGTTFGSPGGGGLPQRPPFNRSPF